jgi:hypothetical protein
VEILNGGSEAWGLFDVKAAVSVDNDARLELRNSLIDTYFLTNTYALAVQNRGELLNFGSNQLRGSGNVPGGPGGVEVYIPDKQLGFRSTTTPINCSRLLFSVHVYATIGIGEPITVEVPKCDVGIESFPYIMDGIFDVNASLVLRHSDDDIIRFRFTEGSGMRINDGGALLTEDLNPDGGSTIFFEGTTATTADAPGWWRGLLFRAEDRTSELDNVYVRDGGREAWAGVADPANISVRNSRLTLTNSEITRGAGWGVFLDGDDRVVFNAENNTYEGNALGAVGADE